MNPSMRRVPILVLAGLLVAGCGQTDHPAPTPTPAPAPADGADLLKPTAGVQDIMAYMIDPAADFLWESVSTTSVAGKVTEKQPHTDEEWNEVRKHAVILTEGANLIMMNGRKVAREGRHLEDHGTPGNLTAEESQAAIDKERAVFESFATALHDVGASMLKAADDRNPQGLIDAGDTLDQVCESCHLKFWYPGQVIPPFPDQAPEVDKK